MFGLTGSTVSLEKAICFLNEGLKGLKELQVILKHPFRVELKSKSETSLRFDGFDKMVLGPGRYNESGRRLCHRLAVKAVYMRLFA